MKRIHCGIGFIVLCFCLSACMAEGNNRVRPAYEVSSSEERIIDTVIPMRLEAEFDRAEIQMFNWDKKQVKLEITKRIRGTRNRDELERELSNLDAFIDRSGGTVRIYGRCSLPPGGAEGCMLMRVYIPGKTRSVKLNIKKGNVHFLDDLNCSLDITAEKSNIEINGIKGRVSAIAGEGSIRISSGRLSDGTQIKTQRGNIDVKASCEVPGCYIMGAESGKITLELPEEIHAVFDTGGSTGEMPADTAVQADAMPAKFKLRSGFGKVEILRK